MKQVKKYKSLRRNKKEKIKGGRTALGTKEQKGVWKMEASSLAKAGAVVE